MKTVRRNVLAAMGAAFGAAALLSALPAMAQGSYPNKPITIVVAYPAGGDVDVLARLMADKLGARLKQSVVVENRTGAAGTIGSAYVAPYRAASVPAVLAELSDLAEVLAGRPAAPFDVEAGVMQALNVVGVSGLTTSSE